MRGGGQEQGRGEEFECVFHGCRLFCGLYEIVFCRVAVWVVKEPARLVDLHAVLLEDRAPFRVDDLRVPPFVRFGNQQGRWGKPSGPELTDLMSDCEKPTVSIDRSEPETFIA